MKNEYVNVHSHAWDTQYFAPILLY